MNFPKDIRYTSEHEWIRVEGDEAYVGITDYAQSELGEIVFIDVPTVGETVGQGEVFGSVEAVKTVSDLNMPVTGEVLELNEELDLSITTRMARDGSSRSASRTLPSLTPSWMQLHTKLPSNHAHTRI